MFAQPPKSVILAALLLIMLVGGGAAWFLYREFGQEVDFYALRMQAQDWISAVPAPLYFIAFALLPAFMVPLSLFYLTALPILGAGSTGLGLVLAWTALLLNIAFTRLLAVGMLRPLIQRLLARQNRSLPTWNQRTEWQTVLAVRLSPVPFPIQNYLLACGKARWRTYLWMSWPIQCLIGLGMMLVGESLLKGELGFILLAACLFICLHLAVQKFRKNLPGTDVPAIE